MDMDSSNSQDRGSNDPINRELRRIRKKQREDEGRLIVERQTKQKQRLTEVKERFKYVFFHYN